MRKKSRMLPGMMGVELKLKVENSLSEILFTPEDQQRT
jgi:hypothetical protein